MNLKSRFESLVFFQKKYNNLHFITEIPFFFELMEIFSSSKNGKYNGRTHKNATIYKRNCF